MEKLVSVIIPSCNDGIYLEKAINSILAQTYSNIEIIVIDSSDDFETLSILEKYEKKIMCFCQPRRGIAAALNFGLDKASGDYIARMDADDISLPRRISVQVKFLEENKEIDVLGTQCDVIDENGQIIGCIDSGKYGDSEIKSNLIFENCIIHPSVMMRRKLIEQGWRYDEDCYAEDLRLWMQMATKGIRFANLKQHLLLYRRSGKNMSSDSSKVAPSAAESALKYAEEMFDLENEYELEDFTRPYYSGIIKKKKSEYIITQLKLLREIYINNNHKKVIDSNQLVKELNNRWKWLYNQYGKDITIFCSKEIFCGDLENNNFFYNEILKRSHLLDDSGLIEILKNILTVSERYVLGQLQVQKTMAIYGCGKRGKDLIKHYEQKFNLGEIKWKLIAISDIKKIQMECLGQQMSTINQEKLVNLNPDIVVISSEKFYDEIYSELIEKGLKSKILSAGWIL